MIMHMSRVAKVVVALALWGGVGCGSMSDFDRPPPAYPPPAPPAADTIVDTSQPVGYDSEAEAQARMQQAQASANAEFDDRDPSALSDFHEALDPHGQWVDDPTYGTVWVPAQSEVGADFEPYVTSGHWALDANDDYVWVSDYDTSFGWVTFHYGRWAYLGSGWGWIPGRRYAPAWVTWRVGEPGYDYIGWAPMPPYYYWRGGYAIGLGFYPPSPYVFCSSREVFAHNVGGSVVRGGAVASVGAHTHAYGSPNGAAMGSASTGNAGMHALATPQRGPSAAAGNIPGGAWSSAPRLSSSSTSAMHANYATPAGMGRSAQIAPTGNANASLTNAARPSANYANYSNSRGSGAMTSAPSRHESVTSPALAPSRSYGSMTTSHSIGQSTMPSASHASAPQYSGASHYGGGSPSMQGGAHYSAPSAPHYSAPSAPHYSAPSAPHSSGGGGRSRGGHRLLAYETRVFMTHHQRFRNRTMTNLPLSILACASLAFAAAALVACADDDHHDDGGYYQTPTATQPSDPAASQTAASVAIDTGATLASPPGAGAGLLVEYESGGVWHFWTVCDTATSGASCHYQIDVWPESGATLTSVSQDTNNGANAVEITSGADHVQATAVTTADTEGFRVTSNTPGSAVQVQVVLDNNGADPRLFFWTSDGVIHFGGPTDPLTFTPTSPLEEAAGFDCRATFAGRAGNPRCALRAPAVGGRRGIEALFATRPVISAFAREGRERVDGARSCEGKAVIGFGLAHLLARQFGKAQLAAQERFARYGLDADVTRLGRELPRLDVIGDHRAEYLAGDARADGGVEDRNHQLDAAAEVARHPVGRGHDRPPRSPPLANQKTTRVLEESDRRSPAL